MFLTSRGFTFHDVAAALPCSLQCARQNVVMLHTNHELKIARWTRKPGCKGRWTAVFVFEDNAHDAPKPLRAPKANWSKRRAKLRREMELSGGMKIEIGMGQLRTFKDQIYACFGQSGTAAERKVR